MRLAEACDIRSGYTLRGRLEPSADGVLAITIADLDALTLDPRSLSRIEAPPFSERHVVWPGDVLFRSRGHHTGAVLVGPDLLEPAVAVMPVFIVRVTTDILRADYLTWLLNQRETQASFDREAQGSSIRMISKQTLEELDIRLPDFETQRRIAAVSQLAEREHALVLRQATLRHDLTAEQLLRCADLFTDTAPDSDRRAE